MFYSCLRNYIRINVVTISHNVNDPICSKYFKTKKNYSTLSTYFGIQLRKPSQTCLEAIIIIYGAFHITVLFVMMSPWAPKISKKIIKQEYMPPPPCVGGGHAHTTLQGIELGGDGGLRKGGWGRGDRGAEG